MKKQELKRKIVIVLALNQVGALSRIISVFGRRGFNMESVTASPTNDPAITRVSIVAMATEETMDQVIAQVEKIELVKAVYPLGQNTLYRELLLLKVKAGERERIAIKELVDVYRGRIIDLSKESMIIELTGSPVKISAFIALLSNFEIVEVSRTGTTGIEASGRTFSAI